MKKHLLFITAILFAGTAFSQNFQNTDRIGGMNSPYTLQKGSLQIEYGLGYSEFKAVDHYSRFFGGNGIIRNPNNLRFRFGFLDRFEIDFGLSNFYNKNIYNDGLDSLNITSYSKDRVNNYSIAGKIQILKDKKIIKGLTFGAGIDFFSTEYIYGFTNKYSNYFQNHQNKLFVYELSGVSTYKKFNLLYRIKLLNKNEYSQTFIYNILLSYNPINSLNTYIGYYENDNRAVVNFDKFFIVGLQYKVSENIFLDVQVLSNLDRYFDLGDPNPNYKYYETITGGLSWNIDFERSGMERFFRN
jgi:hypothetical protein